MVEPEISFYKLEENIKLAENFLKYIIKNILQNCSTEIDFLHNRYEKLQQSKPLKNRSKYGLIELLENICKKPFDVLTYTKAYEILKNSKKK